ncbi:hypothetical protein BX666DRAFT_1991430 [Dichotomocladium elegans]|nr:hypothetical protein BX666DRAFT_1991430 [Dichotomocladium elegans]
MSGGNIKVVVRCRPLNSREIQRGAQCLVRMSGNQTILTKPEELRAKDGSNSADDVKAFTFDHSYWSADKNDPDYADQERVFKDLGVELLDHAFDGYNCCIFAYGQTGSGKSYSMMGYGEDKGIIPRTCSELFERIKRMDDPNNTCIVEVSYIEIYNEKVRDLLNPKNKGDLKVREHPSMGPYVEDLSHMAVSSFEQIDRLMDEGNKARTVAATNMNATSSRSHGVFTLILTQKRKDGLTNLETEKVARISLVDLAGSERANSTGATGDRLKEGANINRSLTALGKVIAGLAEQSMQDSPGKKGRKKEVFVPYRDSVLTWLLKDSLGGNSKTAMIAAISPADYEVTLSTLRYADQAKKIKNKAVINEDPNAKIIRELKEELDLLRSRLRVYAPEVAEQLVSQSAYKGVGGNSSQCTSPTTSTAAPPLVPSISVHQHIEVPDASGQVRKMTPDQIVEQLRTSEKLLANLNETWEDKLKKTEHIHIERERALEELGIAVHKNHVGVYTPKNIPHLVNLSEDPLMSECLVYQLKPGSTHVGNENTPDSAADIKLSGPNIESEHCVFENNDNVVTLVPNEGSLIMVNGMRIAEPRRLRSGFRIILGDRHIFRFNHPDEVRRERDRQKSLVINMAPNSNLLGVNSDEVAWPGSPLIGEIPTFYSEPGEISYASQALLGAVGNDTTITGLTDDELDRLYGELSKVRNSRRSRPVSRATMAGADDDDGSSKDSIRNSMATNTIVDLESVCTDSTFVQITDLEDRMKSEREKLQKVIEEQKLFYETRISRMTMNLLEGTVSTNGDDGQTIYSSIDCERAMKVINKWKSLRRVAMAESVLTHAILLKEANIISRQFEKNATYQFTIVEKGQFAHPMSYWDGTTSSTLQDIDEDDDPELTQCAKPCVGVRVIDRKHQTMQVWSLAKLKTRLQKMRELQNFVDKPMYRKHLNWEDPFYPTKAAKYHLIGSAAVPVRNLMELQSYESRASVTCRKTGKVHGKLRVVVSPIIRTSSNNNRLNPNDIPTNTSTLSPGQQIIFEVRMVELEGLNEAEFTNVHVQFRLSSFIGPAGQDKLFATECMTGFGVNSILLNDSHTLSVTVTDSVIQVLQHGMIAFEVYGTWQPRMFRQLEKWDEQREPAVVLAPDERRSEKELLVAERHDVVAKIQILELMPNGKYVPVQVPATNELDRGVFLLRQGLQRRISITLTHTSGRQLPWTAITNASLGRPRFLDAKGRILDPPGDGGQVPLKLGHQTVVYHANGTSELTAYGAWDSSQHECPFLNCVTTSHCRVLLELRWDAISKEKLQKPMMFMTDVAVQIQGRTSSTLRKLLGQKPPRILSNYLALFQVHLRPPMTRRVSQLWRLNTANKYIRGQEALGEWRPRGVSLVDDYSHVQSKLTALEQVSRTSQHVALHSLPTVAAEAGSHDHNGEPAAEFDADKLEKQQAEEALLRKVVALWQQQEARQMAKELVIRQNPPSLDQEQQQQINAKLLAEVSLVNKTGNVTKKGALTFQEDALDNKWVKRWFVIRRPYIYIYSNRSETDELGVINISSVRIDYNCNLEKMLNVSDEGICNG